MFRRNVGPFVLQSCFSSDSLRMSGVNGSLSLFHSISIELRSWFWLGHSRWIFLVWIQNLYELQMDSGYCSAIWHCPVRYLDKLENRFSPQWGWALQAQRQQSPKSWCSLHCTEELCVLPKQFSLSLISPQKTFSVLWWTVKLLFGKLQEHSDVFLWEQQHCAMDTWLQAPWCAYDPLMNRDVY